MDYKELYISGLSIPEVSEKTGIARSTIRFRLKKLGLLRSRKEAICIARDKGRLGTGMLGKKRVFTDEHKDRIRKSKTGVGCGLSKKPNGYIELTMGENKGRLAHVVLIEEKIGRRLFAYECVHHKDGNKSNNDIENLELMTRSAHSRLHALERLENINRDIKGRFK